MGRRAPSRDEALKSTTVRLAEIMDIYTKLREVRLFDDPDVAPLREACQRYVRDAEPSRGSVRLRALGGRRLRYDLRKRIGQVTYAVINAEPGEDALDF